MAKNLIEKIRNLEKKADSLAEFSKYCPEHRKKLKYSGNDSFGNSVYKCSGPPKHILVCRDEKSTNISAYIGKQSW